MSSRAWVGAGAAVATAIALVLLVRMQVQDAIGPEDDSRVVETVVEQAAPVSTPTPTQLESVHAGPPHVMPSTATPPITPVPILVAANEQTPNAEPLSGWATEPVDADWAPRARTSIFSKLAEQHGLKLVAVNVECRTTMCLVDITQPGVGEPPVQLLNSLGMQPRFIMIRKGELGMQRSVAFLLRPGVALPEEAPRDAILVRDAQFRLE